MADNDIIGIIGAGRLGQAMARTALRAGRNVMLSNTRGPEALAYQRTGGRPPSHDGVDCQAS
jgi:predicted dinucleotide-binding enzyme